MTGKAFIPERGERGAALLTVLLLVAVMATVAATALDRLGVAIRLAGNAAVLAQGRSWLGTAELLAMTRIEDALASRSAGSSLGLEALGQVRSIDLPDGGKVEAQLSDGGNCFNLNSLVEPRGDRLIERPEAQRQFAGLMRLSGIPDGIAMRLSIAVSDRIDTDDEGLGGNTLLLDPSETMAVAGMTPAFYRQVERWLCALPTTDPTTINANALVADEAILLAMLAPDQLGLARARAQIAGRPAGGFNDATAFWNAPPLRGLDVPAPVKQQIRFRPQFVTLKAKVTSGTLDLGETALIDVRTRPARMLWRQWGSET